MHPRIGIIGAGRMGTTHGKCIHYVAKNGLVDATIAGVCDSDPGRLRSYADASGAPLATADPGELIGSPDINTVYICTPTFNHKELALQVVAAGKALFCEKPLAFNAADAAIMRDAAVQAGVTHQVGLVMRYSAVMNVLRALVNEPDTGRPMTASMVDDQFFPIQGHYASTWRGDVSQVGAGTLLEHAIHDMDLLVSFFGPVRRVHGVTRDFSGHDGVEDLTSAMLEFESGAVVTHVSIWHNILHRGSSRRITITAENAQFSFDDSDWCGPIRVDAQRDGDRSVIDGEAVVRRHIELMGIEDERLRAVMTARYTGQDYLYENYAFLKAVSEERAASPGFDEAVYAHRVVDAIYASARSGRAVDMNQRG
jgi:predicted dehydrogenase